MILLSTLGINANVLFLYEYNLFGNYIEHLAALNEIENNDLTVDIFLQTYSMDFATISLNISILVFPAFFRRLYIAFI